MSTKESNLVNVSIMGLNDRLRIVQQNLSRNVSYQDFINDLDGRLAEAEQQLFVRTVLNNTVVDFDDDQVILVNAAVNAVNVTLPLASDSWDAVNNISKTYVIKRIDTVAANEVFVVPQLTALVDGQNDVELQPLSYVRVITDGSNWWFVS